MRPIVTDGVAWYVAIVSLAKMDEPIHMLFGLWTHVGRRNHVLDGVQSRMERGNFYGRGGAAHCKV